MVSVFSPPSQEQAKAHSVRAMFFVVRPNRAELIQIGNLIDTGFIRPVIETVFLLSEARQALESGLSLSPQLYSPEISSCEREMMAVSS